MNERTKSLFLIFLKDFWKGIIPNILSVMRGLVLAPVILYYLSQNEMKIAGALFIVAAITDWLDGFVARKFNQESEIGKFLDYTADKVLVLMPLVYLLKVGIWWWLIALIFVREIIIVLGRVFINGTPELQDAGKVRWSGKIKATVQYIVISGIIFGCPYPNAFMSIAVAFTLWSGWDYLTVFYSTFKNQTSS